jgi:hypothetical protein
MTYLGLAALGSLSAWVAVVTGRSISGARFNRALRAYVSPLEATPGNVVALSGSRTGSPEPLSSDQVLDTLLINR